MSINTINQMCVIVYTLSNISVTEVNDNKKYYSTYELVFVTDLNTNCR